MSMATAAPPCEWGYLACFPSDRLSDPATVDPPSDSSVPPPPPPAPAPARAPRRKDPHDLRANPKVQLAQDKRFATGVLEHYNRNKKVKFELLNVKPVISIPEPRCCYTHINFTARSSKEDSREQLFFAEIYHCGKRKAPSGFIVTCCEPLGSDCAEEWNKLVRYWLDLS